MRLPVGRPFPRRRPVELEPAQECRRRRAPLHDQGPRRAAADLMAAQFGLSLVAHIHADLLPDASAAMVRSALSCLAAPRHRADIRRCSGEFNACFQPPRARLSTQQACPRLARAAALRRLGPKRIPPRPKRAPAANVPLHKANLRIGHSKGTQCRAAPPCRARRCSPLSGSLRCDLLIFFPP